MALLAGDRNGLRALVLACLAVVLLVPLEEFVAGGFAWVAALLATLCLHSAASRRRMLVLLGLILLMGVAPINTARDTAHFFQLGSCFLAAVLVPVLVLRRRDPDTSDWTFWPRRFSWRDVIYTLLSIPLSWWVFKVYFFDINPHMGAQWPMPEVFSAEARFRLVLGINLVGIWDELFFISTVYAILRTLFTFRIANAAQALVYAAVLNHMAFIGIGPLVVFAFALTQGVMFEKSRCLFYVLLVHIIVDFFLVMAILGYHYPALHNFWY